MEPRANTRQDHPRADIKPLVLLTFNMVTARTLVLQAFQNALYLHELFPSSAGMTEWPIILTLQQKCLLSPSVTDGERWRNAKVHRKA